MAAASGVPFGAFPFDRGSTPEVINSPPVEVCSWSVTSITKQPTSPWPSPGPSSPSARPRVEQTGMYAFIANAPQNCRHVIIAPGVGAAQQIFRGSGPWTGRADHTAPSRDCNATLSTALACGRARGMRRAGAPRAAKDSETVAVLIAINRCTTTRNFRGAAL